jgi:hypothetical protein
VLKKHLRNINIVIVFLSHKNFKKNYLNFFLFLDQANIKKKILKIKNKYFNVKKLLSHFKKLTKIVIISHELDSKLKS